MEKETIIFTHFWLQNFGWENTLYNSRDFIKVDFFGESEEEGKVYICSNGLVNSKQICRVKIIK